MNVWKSDCEETVAGTRGNGEVAPIPAIRGSAAETRESTPLAVIDLRVPQEKVVPRDAVMITSGKVIGGLRPSWRSTQGG